MKALVLLFVLIGLALPSESGAASSSSPIGWSVPSHFGERTDSLGRVAEDKPGEVRRGPWPVELRVRGAVCRPGGRYRWSLDGTSIRPARLGRCLFRTSVPREGPYEVGLVAKVDGRRLELSRKIVVQDLLIVSIGDSVAAGEGVPDRGGLANATWQSRRCHRSARAGTALAAKQIEKDDQHTSVTFVHLACSGATIPAGLTGPYAGVESEPEAPPLAAQVTVLNRLEKIRPVDTVLLSVGANDIHFGEVVRFCAFETIGDCFGQPFDPPGPAGDRGQTATQVVGEALREMPREYRDLNERISPAIPRGDIHVVEYFDPTGDSEGHVCAHGPPGVSRVELEQAKAKMLGPLNAAVATAAEESGWDEVGGVAREFRQHGYCADQPWVISLTRSLLALGGSPPLERLLGTVHPDREGQAVIGELISSDLEHQLFPGRVFSHRRPGDAGGSSWSPSPPLCLLAGLLLAATFLFTPIGNCLWEVGGEIGRALRPLLLPLFVVVGVGAVRFGFLVQVLVSAGAILLAWFLVARPTLREARAALPARRDAPAGVQPGLGGRLLVDLAVVLALAVAIWLIGFFVVDLTAYFRVVEGFTASLVTIALVLWALAMFFRLLSFAGSWLRALIAMLVFIALLRLTVALGVLPGESGLRSSLPTMIPKLFVCAAGLLVLDALLPVLPARARVHFVRWLQAPWIPIRATSRSGTLGATAVTAASLVLLGAVGFGLVEAGERGAPLQPPDGTTVEARRPGEAPGGHDAELVRRYAPVLAFTKGERWSPIRVDSYLRKATLYGPEGKIQKGLTLPDLDRACPGGRRDCYHLSIECEHGTTRCAHGRVRERDPERLYREGAVYVRGPLRASEHPALFPEQGFYQGQLRTLIQYWYFYYYDEWRAPVFAGLLTQKHQGDWEVVTLGLDAGARPLFVADSAHCGGSWRRWGEIEVSTKLPGPKVHPLVGVAEGSHANYPDPQQKRTSDPAHCAGLPEGVAAGISYASNIRDKTEYGWAWYPPDRGFVELRRTDAGPMDFPGTWGASDRTTLTNFNEHEIGTAKPGPATPSLQPSWTNPVGTIFCGKYRPPVGIDPGAFGC